MARRLSTGHIPYAKTSIVQFYRTATARTRRVPDWDFAQGPMLFGGDGNAGRLVGAGQKSGMYWAFDADTGALRWSMQAGPPGLTGGLQWGSATDGQRIFVAIANSGLTGSGTAPGDWPQKDGADHHVRRLVGVECQLGRRDLDDRGSAG